MKKNTAIWFQLSSEKTKFGANHTINHKFSITENAKNGGAHKNFMFDPSQIYLLVNSCPGFMNERPILMPYDP